MARNLVLFFVLALCAVQGYSKISTDDDQLATEVIRAIEKKLQQITESLTIPLLHDRIIAEIKTITGETPGINQCIEERTDDIDSLAEWIKNTVQQTCIEDTQTRIKSIKEDISQVLEKYAAVTADIHARVEACIVENVGNDEGLAKCLQDQVKPVQDELFQIEIEVRRIMDLAKLSAQETEMNLNSCIYNMNIRIWTQEKSIIDAINECTGTHTGFQSIDNYYEKEVVFGIWETIKDIIQNIQNALGNIAGNIQEIFKKLQNKINEIIEGLNLNEVIEKIIQKIKDIIGQVGGKVSECVDEQRPAIEALAQESQTETLKCVQTAQDQVVGIRAKVEELVAKATALKDDITDRALACIKNNILNPSAILPCFKEQVGVITEEISALREAALTLISEAREIATQAAVELGNCMSAVAETTNSKQMAIIEEIQKCISA